MGVCAGLLGLGLYLLRRPAGSPQLLIFAWPALFGSLGVQFLRAAAAESGAYGFWLCGIVFLVLAAVPVVLVVAGERGAMVPLLVGDGLAEPDGIEDQRQLGITRLEGDGSASRCSDLGPVDLRGFAPASDDLDRENGGDLGEHLDRLSRLHRQGELSDAEFAEAKQKVRDGS
ncbi:MAG TPA: SHOCT domain-containing protein [Acidimicrobiales bacterium]